MKNLMIALTVALSATFASANQDVNVKKLNKVVKTIVESEQTDVINKLVVKFDEKSNFSSVEKLKTGILLSATAKQSVWSNRPSTIDAKATLKTVNSDAAHTKAQMDLVFGSKTEAVPLYAYAAKRYLESEETYPTEDANDQAFRDLLKEAAQTKSLNQIPAQLEKLIVIFKASLKPSEDVTWVNLINSLKVESNSSVVVLKTTTDAALDFFGSKILISNLALKVSENGISFGASIAATTETEQVVELLEAVKGFLLAIQNADSEMMQELKAVAAAYVDYATELVKGE